MSPEVVSGTGHGEHRVAPIIATYTALVSTDVISSELEIGSAAERVRDTLESAPEYADAWPPRPLATSLDRRTDIRTLALARLKTLFDFGAQLPDGQVGEVRQHMAARWPEILAPTPESSAGKEGPYERIRVTAIVRADGNPEWGFERSPTSGRPLPFDAKETRGRRPELDLFVQNLVRADIETRLAAAP